MADLIPELRNDLLNQHGTGGPAPGYEGLCLFLGF